MNNKKLLQILFSFFLISQFSVAQVDVVYNDLVWSDEFSTNGAVDANNWFHQTQLPAGGNWFNNEVQHYTNQITNSYVNSGLLSIVAKNWFLFNNAGSNVNLPSETLTPNSPFLVRISSFTCPVIPGCCAPRCEGVCE